MTISRPGVLAALAVAWLAAFAGAAAAQFSADIDVAARGFYRVSGVAAGDRLNARAAPSASAAVTGGFAPGALVFATGRRGGGGGGWLEVNSGEGRAWVSGAFLARQQVVTLAGTRAPVAGSCGGFEPGWSARWSAGRIEARAMDGPLGTGALAAAFTPEGVPAPAIAQFAGAGGDRLTLVLDDRECDALPVDSESYQSGLLLVESGGRMTAYYGCCDPGPGAIAPAR